MPNNLTVELPDLSGLSGLSGLPFVPNRAISVPGREMASTLPLRGITILAVEDSRFASEALRLMCQRLGARLRRAETIQAARSHLRLYKPNVVIIDLGLPDGRGEALIREIVVSPHAPIVLGTSGDAAGRASALAAGAEGFLDKPLESLAAFQDVLIRHLPEKIIGLPSASDEALAPDTLALRDDFARAAALIDGVGGGAPGGEAQAYLTGFLTGIARHAHDSDLALAAEGRDGTPAAQQLDHLRQLLNRRLAATDQGFGAAQPG